MAKFVSRKDIHADEIRQINDDIANLQNSTRDTQYLSMIIKILTEIDYQYFHEIIQDLRSQFDIDKYYFDTDKNKNGVKNEVINLIENYIHEVEVMKLDNSNDMTYFTNEGRLKISSPIYQDKSKLLKTINQDYAEQLASLVPLWEAKSQSLTHTQLEPQVMAGLIKQNEQYDTFAIVKMTHDLMQKQLTAIHEQKNRYKIKFKWFLWLGPLLLLIMVLAIIIPFVI